MPILCGVAGREGSIRRLEPEVNCGRFPGHPLPGALAGMAESSMSQDPIIFDRQLLRDRRRRAERLGASDFLIERVADDIGERLAAVMRTFDLAVDLGTRGAAVRRALRRSGKVGAIV